MSQAEHLRPDEDTALSRDDFARLAGLGAGEVQDLVDYGLLAPDALDMQKAFALRAATKYRADFDLDLFTTGLLAGFIGRIEDLEGELRRCRAERSARTAYSEVSFTSVSVTRRA